MSLIRLLKVIVSLMVAVGLGALVAPSAALIPAIQQGVKIDGIPVGGVGAGSARSRLDVQLNRPVRVVYQGRRWTFPRTRFGTFAVDAAVKRALAADADARVTLPVRIDGRALADAVRQITRQIARPAVDAKLVGLDRSGRPRIGPDRSGIAVSSETLEQRLVRALGLPARNVAVPAATIEPRVTRAEFGPVIVIDRGANTLRLFDGKRLVRRFRVATGQSSYPTPTGTFEIVTKQENPWWYPPPSPWARGLRPVPPGPGNPLGTRWMGLSAAGVGIHGTPSDTSIGYSASHGCIRMHIPEAVWLFQHVDVGTPVVIV